MASLVTRVTRPGQTQQEERREEKVDVMRLTSRGLTEGAGELHRDLEQENLSGNVRKYLLSVAIIVADQISNLRNGQVIRHTEVSLVSVS